ncbi:hypothetical protein HPB49_019116 [Dermacentor silvarum]|uniref:Uncharacterized protein n=1 Tax=Dermacentor silvarum TaxID=543639 RepID=A0ACB8CAT3_DERSI|nr:uncharacterized protein LOC119460874 [Dermacentor silvarum]KAH7938013.1 hypothetical protein HPB49_019116 [Dermacentor silvarum]
MTPAAKKGKYDAKFKLQVIQFAERFSNRAAGTKFGLNESTIRGWRKVKKAATTPPATPPPPLPPRGHATAALGWQQQPPQHQAPPVMGAAYCVPRPPGEPLVRAEPWPRDTWCGGEPARALAAADASTHYRKCPAREPQASEPPSPARAAAAPAFLPCEYPHGYAHLVPHPAAPLQQQPAPAPPPVKRVLLRGSDYGNGFPEVTVPFTVIAEKALRALCDQRGQAAPSPACASNREVFASFLGLTPNRLVDNVT